MDYKYIEQLLERYWECETTLQEEQILRSFFQQEDVPEHLRAYASVFCVQKEMAEARLGEDFDARVLQQVGQTVKAKGVSALNISWGHRLRPFYQAAGLVALLLTIGTAAQESFSNSDAEALETEQYAQEGTEQVTDGDVTAIPCQQSAALDVQSEDTMEYTR